MKLKKLSGFSLGLIALAVGNAYATQLLDDYSIISYMTDEESPIEIKDNNPISNGEYLTTGFAPIFPDICYHLTHYKPAAADIPVASDNPAHYADAIRYNAR
ncbi:hypothetical protein U9308_24660, partial [Escherichia coli]